MSSPPVGYFDIYKDGKVINAFQSTVAYFNRDAVDLGFGFNAARDVGQINVLTFDYNIRSEKAPFEYALHDAPAVTFIGLEDVALSLQGGKLDITPGATLKEIDILIGTDKNDTFILATNKGPEVLSTGDGNDLVIDNHTPDSPIGVFSDQRLTILGGGSDTFLSHDKVADLVIAQDRPFTVNSDADTIIASAGSLVIAGPNDTVISATGNMDDIKVMSIAEFGEAFINDPLGFLRDHSTLSPYGGSESKIDAGLLLAAAQEILLPLFPNFAYDENGIVGITSPSGVLIPMDSDFSKLMNAFRLVNNEDIPGALEQLADLGLDSYEEAFPLLRAMAGTFDQTEGHKLGVPLPVTGFGNGDVIETALDPIPMGNCTAYATYEQFGYPEEDIHTTGYNTAYTPEIF